MSSRPVQVAARGASRTLEGILAQAAESVKQIYPVGGLSGTGPALR